MESYTIHPICAGRFASAEKSNFAYQKSAGEKLAAPILMYLVTGKNTCMLVDTGCCDEAWAAAYHHPLTQTEDMKPVNALKKLGVVLKRARYFILCSGKSISPLPTDNPAVIAGAVSDRGFSPRELDQPEQLSLFAPTKEDGVKCLTGQI